MRLGILFLILVATIFGGSFWYDEIAGVCKVPIAYRIGNIDERFDTDAEELRRIALRAEVLWEKSLKTDLFVYDENAEFPINLIFDERQENADREAEIREDLEAKEGMSEGVSAQYEKLITEFRRLKKQYESRVFAYEASLKIYNEKVTEWNKKGGAPENVISDLREEEAELDEEYEDLQTLSKKINLIVVDLNKIGASGNSLVADYNSIVENYNEEFSDAHEFTQGDYTQKAISIYQFDSEDELVLVLAHEFGHALSLGHVENEASIMYHFMEKQDVESGITPQDIAEYTAVCSQKNPLLAFMKAMLSR